MNAFAEELANILCTICLLWVLFIVSVAMYLLIRDADTINVSKINQEGILFLIVYPFLLAIGSAVISNLLKDSNDNSKT